MRYLNATSFQRFLAYLIDYFVILFISSIILSFVPFYTVQSEAMMDMLESFMVNPEADIILAVNLLRTASICLLVQSLVMVPLIIVYQVVLPRCWKSQTLGRLIAGVRVMKHDKDEVPSVGKLILRETIGGFILNTLLIQTMIVPLLNLILSRERGRSLADLIGGTRLVDYKLAKLEEKSNYKPNENVIDVEFNEVKEPEIIEQEEVETEYKVF